MVAVPIKMTIAYDGTNYKGWQRQTHAPTIQGTIESALTKILKSPTKITGASRTDSGVHAIGQVANFSTNLTIPLKRLQFALNSVLPKDIVVLKIEKAKPDFNARHSAKLRTYRYTILNNHLPDPFLRNSAFHVAADLNIAKMKEAAKLFIGIHDFRAFCRGVDKTTNCKRTIKRVTIQKKDKLIIIAIAGHAFLSGMIRTMVKLLIDIGKRKFKPSAVKAMLNSGDKTVALAPGHGLCLVKVQY